MRRVVLIIATIMLLSDPIASAQTVTASGAEKPFGPAVPGAPYLTVPDGTLLDANTAYIPVAVPGTAGAYISVGDLMRGTREAYVDRQISEMGALSSSITIMQPNPGDRVAITGSGATVDGRSAGSIAVSVRANDHITAFGAFATSANHSLSKGGVSLSF